MVEALTLHCVFQGGDAGQADLLVTPQSVVTSVCVLAASTQSYLLFNANETAPQPSFLLPGIWPRFHALYTSPSPQASLSLHH